MGKTQMRKPLAFTLILLTLTGTLGAVYIQPINAQYQGNVTINPDGTISPTDAPIMQTGNIYLITSNFAGSIKMNISNVVLDGNNFTLFGVGENSLYGVISLSQVSNVTVENFVIPTGSSEFPNGYLTIGISITNCTNATVKNNYVTGFASVQALNGILFAAIAVMGGNSNTIIENNLMYNLDGIALSRSNNNQIIANNIVGANLHDVYSTGISLSEASNNVLYHNNVINVTTGAWVSGSSNQWEAGYPNGGNYWADYKTKYPNAGMIDNSGIGNTAYVIDEQNQDRYPLLKPFNNILYATKVAPPAIALLAPTNQGYNESTVPLTFTVDREVQWISYSLDQNQNVVITGNGTIANLTNGLHTLTIYANSTYGTLGSSQTISFKVSMPEAYSAFPIIVAAVLGITVAAIGLGLAVYLKKRRR
jgi:parallel beta-helix repeat protein